MSIQDQCNICVRNCICKQCEEIVISCLDEPECRLNPYSDTCKLFMAPEKKGTAM